MAAQLVDAFRAGLAPELGDLAAATQTLADDLTALVERARAEAPGVDLDPAAFATYVAERVTFDREGQPALGSLRAGPLWIAFGCVSADPSAITAFETEYAPQIGRALRRSFDRGTSEDAELKLRERLFLVGDDDAPRLALYSGRGDLGAWLRTAAVRTALDLTRRRRLIPADSATLDDEAASYDPLLAALKQRYRDEFRDAFHDAAATLTDRERALLRYRFLDDLSIDEIGALYEVHRATVARWIAAIRERLFEETRARLMAQLAVGDTDVDSVLRLIDSHLDLSIEAAIRS